MANKITYLLGAGASANAVPIVKQIPVAIAEQIKFISGIVDNDIDYIFQNTEFEVRTLYLNDLEDLRIKAKSHSSLDSYAMKLSRRDHYEYIRIKYLISIFFSIEQIKNIKDVDIDNRFDKRYDNFICNLYNKNELNGLPNNIAIISWNYDLQIEFALANFHSSLDAIDINNLHSRFNFFPSANIEIEDRQEDSFSVVKLNGTAGLFTESNVSEIKINFNEPLKKCIHSLLNLYFNFTSHFYKKDIKVHKNYLSPDLYFSWDTNKKARLEKAKSISEDTETLIIIGYSLHDYNDSIDTEIIQNMSRLQRVIIQSYDIQSAEEVKERFLAIRPNMKEKISIIQRNDSFYLPKFYNETQKVRIIF